MRFSPRRLGLPLHGNRRTLAHDLGLGMSGSSDYHGSGKPNRLGENLMPLELLDRIVDEGALPLITA